MRVPEGGFSYPSLNYAVFLYVGEELPIFLVHLFLDKVTPVKTFFENLSKGITQKSWKWILQRCPSISSTDYFFTDLDKFFYSFFSHLLSLPLQILLWQRLKKAAGPNPSLTLLAIYELKKIKLFFVLRFFLPIISHFAYKYIEKFYNTHEPVKKTSIEYLFLFYFSCIEGKIAGIRQFQESVNEKQPQFFGPILQKYSFKQIFTNKLPTVFFYKLFVPFTINELFCKATNFFIKDYKKKSILVPN